MAKFRGIYHKSKSNKFRVATDKEVVSSVKKFIIACNNSKPKNKRQK